jgi:hypothetical protein
LADGLDLAWHLLTLSRDRNAGEGAVAMFVGVSTESLWLSADERVLPGQVVTQPVSRARAIEGEATPAIQTSSDHYVQPSDDRRAFGQVETVAFAPTRELTFRDFLSAINPLQHLPIVGTLYRDITGDTLSPEARLAGGMLFGGPIGMIFAAVNAAAEEETGRDYGAQTLAALRGEDTTQPPANSAAALRLAKATDPAASPALAALSAPAPAAVTDAPAAAPEARALTQAPGGIAVSSLGPAAAALNATPASTAAAATAPTGVEAGQPAAATGLTTRSGLPGAGSITPAAIAVQTAQQAPAAQPAAPAQTAADGIARNPREQRTFDAPQRTNNIQPRTPQPGFRPDLQPGARQAGSGLQVTRDQPVGPTPITPASTAATAPVAPVVPAGMAPNATVPDAMQRALDKYDALLRGRRPGGSVNQTS